MLNSPAVVLFFSGISPVFHQLYTFPEHLTVLFQSVSQQHGLTRSHSGVLRAEVSPLQAATSSEDFPIDQVLQLLSQCQDAGDGRTRLADAVSHETYTSWMAQRPKAAVLGDLKGPAVAPAVGPSGQSYSNRPGHPITGMSPTNITTWN